MQFVVGLSKQLSSLPYRTLPGTPMRRRDLHDSLQEDLVKQKERIERRLLLYVGVDALVLLDESSGDGDMRKDNGLGVITRRVWRLSGCSRLTSILENFAS